MCSITLCDLGVPVGTVRYGNGQIPLNPPYSGALLSSFPAHRLPRSVGPGDAVRQRNHTRVQNEGQDDTTVY